MPRTPCPYNEHLDRIAELRTWPIVCQGACSASLTVAALKEKPVGPHPDEIAASISFDRLVDFVAALFAATGCDAEEARAVGFGLAEANLVGHDSHGVLRVPIYLGHLEAGIVRRGARPELVADSGAVATFDGRSAWAGRGRRGHRLWHGKAKEIGTATIALRNVGHLGRIGRFAEQAADAGLISLHFVNTSGGAAAEVLLVAPFGGRTGGCR